MLNTKLLMIVVLAAFLQSNVFAHDCERYQHHGGYKGFADQMKTSSEAKRNSAEADYYKQEAENLRLQNKLLRRQLKERE